MILFYAWSLCLISTITADDIVRRMEYKYSLKPPNIAAEDKTVPLWDLKGDVIPGHDEIRIASSQVDTKGSIWTKQQYEGHNWEIETAFRIHGGGKQGTDGMAIWFVSERSEVTSTFGGPDKWNGLAIILDSFDNDNKGNNPLIGVFVNNGSYQYSHDRDGEHQLIAGCISDYRNKPFPVYLKINYFNNVLTLEVSDGLTAKPSYHPCGRKDGIQLPMRGYFGVSASTGKSNPDDHDCVSFIVHSIVRRDHAVMQDATQRKQLEEYMRRAEQMNAAQEEYARRHPEKVRQQRPEEQAIPVGSDQDIRLIYEMYGEIRQSLGLVLSKLNEIIGRQESYVAMLSRISSNDVGGAIVGNVKGTSQEYQRILQSHAELTESSRRLNKDVQDLLMHVKHSASGAAPAVDAPWKREVLEKLSILVNRKGQRDTQSSPNKLIWLVIILQAFTLIGALTILGRAEQTVKKFY